MIGWLLADGKVVWFAIVVLVVEYALLRHRIEDKTYLWTSLSGLALMVALYAAITERNLMVIIALTAGFFAHCLDIRGRLSR